MQKLIKEINQLKQKPIKKTIDKRIKEFSSFQNKPINKIFNELCFCILTANSTAERCIDVQKKIGNGFLKLNKKQLIKKLKKLSCRFHTKRASYIIEARKKINKLNKALKKDPEEARLWIANNIKGLGIKESSHFLRNIGYTDIAIIDFHIIDLLEKNNIIKKPKALNEKTYLEIEEILRKTAKKAKLNLAELDLYLWYLETGKVLK